MSKVVIVGRTNVGKSTLFNRLSNEVKSITLDYAGVTRDFVRDIVEWDGVEFELIDTGGLEFGKTQDPILKKVREVGLELVKEADLIIFVCDGTIGVLPEDREISNLLHKLNKKVILVSNKIDTKKAQENQYEFEQLGFKNFINISAQHSIGIGDLLSFIVDIIRPLKISKKEEPLFKVSLLGKPNVGKSSLLNLLVKNERAIVSDIPGTTREALSEKIKFYKETIQITDTAGVRRKRSIKENIENLMVKSTFDAVRHSEIVLLLVDVSQASISDQELKLAFYVFEQGKALIILFNKQDLLTEQKKKELDFSLEPYNYLFDKIETLNISCQTGKNIGHIIPLIDQVWKKYSQKFSDVELNSLFKKALQNKPLHHKTLPLIVYSASQVQSSPITILLMVNEPKWFGESQLAFFEKLLRQKYDLKGVPIVFVLKKKNILK